MRKIVLTFLMILVSASIAFGASTKISELTETQTLTDDDLFLVSTYLTGAYTSKYIKTQYVKSALGVMTIANDTLWDAAGDLVYGTGANTGARLAIGAPYALLMTNAGATAPAWTYTLGAPGTRLTKGWFTDLEITNAPTINGAALTTILQPLDGELTALAGLTSAANAIPYFTGSGTAGVISSSANMVSLLESEDYATALSNLGGQASDSALTTLSSKTFSKTALTGTGGLDTVLYADLADGDIGMVGTVAGIIYWYVFEASSSAAESSPSVIAPDDVGVNNGRWLLKLYCDGSSCTVPQATTGSYQTLLEGSAGGTNFRRTSVPDALTADLNLQHANALPAANQFQLFPAPTDGVSAYTWTTYGAFGALNITSTGYIAMGADPADAGTIRMPNAGSIQFEADETGTDINALSVDSSEVVQIGASGASGVTITPAATFSSTVAATSVSTTAGAATGGYLRLLEGSNNGTDYSSITGVADAGTTAAFTFGGSSTTEDLVLTIPASTSTEATVTSTSGITSLNFSAIQVRDTKVITADIDNEAMTASSMGRIWTNTGDANGTVFTLPEASTVLGQSVTFIVLVAQNLDVNPNDGTDQIMGLTNAAGDAVRCATIGCTLTLTAAAANVWAVTGSYGTWADVD